MTYSVLEASAYSGAPVELYEFNRGVDYWRFTSADEDQTWNGQTFVRAALTRSTLDESSEMNKINLEITLSRDNAVADLFRLYPPGDVVTVKIWRRHRGDADAVLVWIGRVLNCEWRGGEAFLHSEPAYTSIRRNALRRHYQRQCPHVLYGAACGINRALFKVAGTVAAIGGNTVQVNAAGGRADGYFAGGFLAWNSAAGVSDNRMVTGHAGVTLTLAAPIVGLAVGDTVDLYPGCDHTLSTCKNTFANTLNYGGWPYIPLKNPFNLQTLY